MTKILSTIGPISSNTKNYIEFISRKSKILRLNMSHNSLNWHKKNISLIKKIDPDKVVAGRSITEILTYRFTMKLGQILSITNKEVTTNVKVLR